MAAGFIALPQAPDLQRLPGAPGRTRSCDARFSKQGFESLPVRLLDFGVYEVSFACEDRSGRANQPWPKRRTES